MELKPITAVVVLLLVVASLLVSGCTTSTTQNISTGQQTVNSASAKEQVSAVNVTVPQQIGLQTPKTGYKFVGFNVTTKDISANPGQSDAAYWTLRDTSGHVYTYSDNATYDMANVGKLPILKMYPGDTVSGIIIFEVPQNATLKSLTYNGYASQNVIITL